MAEEKAHSGFKKYTINTSFLFLERVLRAVVMIIFWVFVIRYLGPQQFGVLSYALSLIFLFSDLCEFGIRDIAVREIVRHPHRENELLGSILFIKFIGSLIAISLTVIYLVFFSSGSSTNVIVCILALQFLFTPFETLEYYFQSQVLAKFLAYSRVFEMLISSALYITFVFLKKPLIYFAWVNVFEFVIMSAGLVFFYARLHKSILNWKISASIVKEMFKVSWPLIFASVAASIYFRIDQVMIKSFLNITEVGYYSAAVRVSEAFYFIPIVITSSVLPAIIYAKKESSELYNKRIDALLCLLAMISFTIAVFITIFAHPIVSMFFGPEFLPAAGVLSIHIWGSLFIFVPAGGKKWIISENLQMYAMITAVLGAILNIVLNYFLLPIYGIKGAAAATVIAFAFSGIFGYAFFKQTWPIFILQLKAFNLFYLWQNRLTLSRDLLENAGVRK